MPYRKGRLYYVGLASDLKWRLGSHLKDRHSEKWGSFQRLLNGGRSAPKRAGVAHAPRDPAKAERQQSFPSKSPCRERLLRRFKRDIKEYQKKELSELTSASSRSSQSAGGTKRIVF